MPDDPSSDARVPADGQYLCWLDWIRFLAALAVVCDHVRAFNWVTYDVFRDDGHPVAGAVIVSLFSLGKQAVVVFFVLSGWLVGGHTIRKIRAGAFDATGYAADRLSRVYVPLVPALLLTLAVVRVLGESWQSSQYVACLFSVQDVFSFKTPGFNAPLWSLAYEVWFYVLAGGAAMACRRAGNRSQRLAGGTVAAVAVGICTALNGTYLGCWLMGAAGFWVRDRLSPAVRPWTALAGVALIAAGTVIFQIDAKILPTVSQAVVDVLPASDGAQLIVAAGALLLIASLVSMTPGTHAGRRIERAGVPLAAFSYSLYLTHYPVLWLVSEGAGQPTSWSSLILQAIAWVAVCLLVAVIMYLLFERQTPRVRRWLRTRFGGGPARAEAVRRQPPLAVEA